MITQGYQLTRKGVAHQAFRWSDITLPPPAENEVLIEVEAFGLNWADIMLRQGLYHEKPRLPCVPGYEVVGKIIATGSSVSPNMHGKRVVAFTRYGGYAKHAIARADTLAEAGKHIDANTALALALQGVTAWYMSQYISPIQSSNYVLIHAAAGGVGSLLIQLAKNAGATVIAKVSSDRKKQHCLQLGADYAINYKTCNYAQAIRKILGFRTLDVSYNCVGGNTFGQDRQLLGTGSRLFLYGGAQLNQGRFGILSQINFLWKMGCVIPVFLSTQSRSLIGVNVLRLADAQPEIFRTCLHAIIHLYENRKIKPHNGGNFSCTELVQAHAFLESGKSTGKIAVFM